MPEYNKNLWAPWRMEYIRSLGEEAPRDGCFLCDYWISFEKDAEHHIIWRTPEVFVVLNRFPYTNGHLLVSLGSHKGELDELSDAELCDMSRTTRDAVRLLRAVIKPQGFNIGYNLGQCAGAGLPGHLHAHIVPRWSGDTNFMAILGDVRVVPEALDVLYGELCRAAGEAGLRPA